MSFLTQATNWIVAAALWLGVVVAIAGVIGIVVRRAVIKSRKAQAVLEPHAVLDWCADHGHSYQVHDTGLACGICGNFVARHEGEQYGPPQEGFVDRRRQERYAA